MWLSVCERDSVAVWCLCIISAQWYKRKVTFSTSLLCLYSSVLLIFLWHQCKYWSSFQRAVLYSLECGTKEIINWQYCDFSPRALLLFSRSQAEGDMLTRLVSRAEQPKFPIQCMQIKTKQTFLLVTPKPSMDTYLSCRFVHKKIPSAKNVNLIQCQQKQVMQMSPNDIINSRQLFVEKQTYPLSNAHQWLL